MHPTTRELSSAMGVKLWRGQRPRLEAIQYERGHDSLNETIREAVEEYIARHERERLERNEGAA